MYFISYFTCHTLSLHILCSSFCIINDDYLSSQHVDDSCVAEHYPYQREQIRNTEHKRGDDSFGDVAAVGAPRHTGSSYYIRRKNGHREFENRHRGPDDCDCNAHHFCVHFQLHIDRFRQLTETADQIELTQRVRIPLRLR